MNLGLPRLKRNQQRGSKPRCHLLTQGTPETVAARLTALAAPFASIAKSNDWMPQGFDRTDEATLPEAARLLPEAVRVELKRWWLAVPSNNARTPNWDVASSCTIKGKPGLVLIEAKAHDQELIKEETGRKNIEAPVSASARRNLLRIEWAIRDAALRCPKVPDSHGHCPEIGTTRCPTASLGRGSSRTSGFRSCWSTSAF